MTRWKRSGSGKAKRREQRRDAEERRGEDVRQFLALLREKTKVPKTVSSDGDSGRQKKAKGQNGDEEDEGREEEADRNVGKRRKRSHRQRHATTRPTTHGSTQQTPHCFVMEQIRSTVSTLKSKTASRDERARARGRNTRHARTASLQYFHRPATDTPHPAEDGRREAGNTSPGREKSTLEIRAPQKAIQQLLVGLVGETRQVQSVTPSGKVVKRFREHIRQHILATDPKQGYAQNADQTCQGRKGYALRPGYVANLLRGSALQGQRAGIVVFSKDHGRKTLQERRQDERQRH